MTVGIVGYGSFGKLVHTLTARFAPEGEVRVYSSRFEPDGKIFFSLEDTAAADAVVLCVPIHSFEETLKKILPHTRPDTVLIDVATVKTYTTEILKRVAGKQPYLASHPMFGPESYEKKAGNISGFRIVLTDGTIPVEEYKKLTTFLTQWGFDVVEMSAGAHDKHLAETLFLTHFVGQIIARAGFDRTQIDTVSFGYLMDAVESVKSDTALFQDVFKFNPYCEEVLKRFELAEFEVHSILKIAPKEKE